MLSLVNKKGYYIYIRRRKTGFISDFKSLFFIKCSYFHIKNSLKYVSEHCLRPNLCTIGSDVMFRACIGAQHLQAQRATTPAQLSQPPRNEHRRFYGFVHKLSARVLQASIDWLYAIAYVKFITEVRMYQRNMGCPYY